MRLRDARAFVALPTLASGLLIACAAARPPTGEQREPSGPSGDPLVGRFVLPPGPGEECGVDFEVVQLEGSRGLAELNGLNDDGDGALCSFARLALTRADDGAILLGEPPLFACRSRLVGDTLELACEDHDRPPPDLRDALVLSRSSVVERHGLAALVGTWIPPAFWGDAHPITIDSDGGVDAHGMHGRLSVEADRDLVRFALGGVDQRCRFRALEDKLTLACARGTAPATIDGGPRTMVFRRAPAPQR